MTQFDAFIIGIAPDELLYSKLYLNELIVGTEFLPFDIKMKAFPNPCIDYLFLETQSQIEDVTIELSNSRGQILSSNYFQNMSLAQIPTHSLSAGIYFLNITNGKRQTKTISFVKSKS